MFRVMAKDWRRGGNRLAGERRRTRLRPTLIALEDRQLLSTFTVTNTLDDGSVGSLRYEIGLANAVGGTNTIAFNTNPALGTNFSTPQTITLAGTPLELSTPNESVTITGPVGGLTISGGGLSGVFQVDNGVTASISDLTITGGETASDGAGLYNAGTTALTDCTITGNTAVGGSVTNEGGGIFNSGTLELMNSTITGNQAGYSPNYYPSYGGGIFNSGLLTVTGSTITGNSSGGYYTGGGLFNSDGTVTLTDTIVTGNTTIFGSGDYNDITGPVSGTYNLIGTGYSGGLTNGVDGNLVGVTDALLGTLGNFGGPTETIPLLPGSPAIDAGTAAGACTTDQRGEPRTGSVDIGAFQSQGFTVVAVAGSTPQTAAVGAAFANPLGVTVTANNPIEPVDGGVVTFVINPAADGASAIGLASSAVIADGQASVSGGPNNANGSFTVTASIPGTAPVSFNLTNTGAFGSLSVNTTSGALFAGPGLLSLSEAVAFANLDDSGHATDQLQFAGVPYPADNHSCRDSARVKQHHRDGNDHGPGSRRDDQRRRTEPGSPDRLRCHGVDLGTDDQRR